MTAPIIIATAISFVAPSAPSRKSTNVVPVNQKPVFKVYHPPTARQSRPGTGKFVIFTRTQVGMNWDFVAEAWECIPSLPKIPITKRIEFCRSSWNATPLLDTGVADDSEGMYPRFVRLQVDNSNGIYTVNLYDINYRTWEVHCRWQGSRLSAFGVLDDSIFCRSPDGWLLLHATSGKLSKEIPFTPIGTDGGFWLVRKPGEVEGCWSYDPRKRQYIAHFGDPPAMPFSLSSLSLDGKNRAWVLASVPRGWRKGVLSAILILQRSGQKDLSVPVEMEAFAGSGRPVIPENVQLEFSAEDKLQFRAGIGGTATERVWTIDVGTGKTSSEVVPHSKTPVSVEGRVIYGVPVPDYLQKYVPDFTHFGRSGLAPAFLLHLGILKQRPEYPDCTAGVSRDGRHILYCAKQGPMAGVIVYGDLLTKQTVRWNAPAGFDHRDSAEFVWVETPPETQS